MPLCEMRRFLLTIFLFLLNNCGASTALIHLAAAKAVTAQEAEKILEKQEGRADLLPFCAEIRYLKEKKSFACQRNGNWGLLSERGYLLIKPECQDIGYYKTAKKSVLKSLYLCEFTDKTTLFNSSGNPLRTAKDSEYLYAKGFRKNIILIKEGGLFGVMDKEGKVILEPQYEEIDCNYFYTGRYSRDERACLLRKNDKLGIIRHTGQLVFDAVCDEAHVGKMISNWSYKCIKGDKAFYYGHKLKLLRVAPKDDDFAGNYRYRRMP